jgi:hypothetical protein
VKTLSFFGRATAAPCVVPFLEASYLELRCVRRCCRMRLLHVAVKMQRVHGC